MVPYPKVLEREVNVYLEEYLKDKAYQQLLAACGACEKDAKSDQELKQARWNLWSHPLWCEGMDMAMRSQQLREEAHQRANSARLPYARVGAVIIVEKDPKRKEKLEKEQKAEREAYDQLKKLRRQLKAPDSPRTSKRVMEFGGGLLEFFRPMVNLVSEYPELVNAPTCFAVRQANGLGLPQGEVQRIHARLEMAKAKGRLLAKDLKEVLAALWSPKKQAREDPQAYKARQQRLKEVAQQGQLFRRALDARRCGLKDAHQQGDYSQQLLWFVLTLPGVGTIGKGVAAVGKKIPGACRDFPGACKGLLLQAEGLLLRARGLLVQPRGFVPRVGGFLKSGKGSGRSG